MVQRGSGFERHDVAVGTMSATEAVVTNGLDAGVSIARNAAAVAGGKGRR
jgi:hypothetical protein